MESPHCQAANFVYTKLSVCVLCPVPFFTFQLQSHFSDTKSTATSHLINLAFLQHFYDDQDLQHIEPDSLYSGIPLVDTPPINFYTNILDRIFGSRLQS